MNIALKLIEFHRHFIPVADPDTRIGRRSHVADSDTRIGRRSHVANLDIRLREEGEFMWRIHTFG